MRGLFFKIFILFWIAQSLIFVISTSLILAHRMQRQDFGFDPSTMQTESTQAVKAFDSSGCDGFRKFTQDRRDEAELLDATGGVACNQSDGQMPTQLALVDGVRAIQIGN